MSSDRINEGYRLANIDAGQSLIDDAEPRRHGLFAHPLGGSLVDRSLYLFRGIVTHQEQRLQVNGTSQVLGDFRLLPKKFLRSSMSIARKPGQAGRGVVEENLFALIAETAHVTRIA